MPVSCRRRVIFLPLLRRARSPPACGQRLRVCPASPHILQRYFCPAHTHRALRVRAPATTWALDRTQTEAPAQLPRFAALIFLRKRSSENFSRRAALMLAQCSGEKVTPLPTQHARQPVANRPPVSGRTPRTSTGAPGGACVAPLAGSEYQRHPAHQAGLTGALAAKTKTLRTTRAARRQLWRAAEQFDDPVRGVPPPHILRSVENV
eukprot:scaffold121_cov412-Prasinococcus_capsulatus_cf.AAC.2